MNIELLNVRIKLLQKAVTVDEIGNHKNGWQEYYSAMQRSALRAARKKRLRPRPWRPIRLTLRSAIAEKLLLLLLPVFVWNSPVSPMTLPPLTT